MAFLIAKTVNPSPQGFGSLEDLVTELSAAIEARDKGRINQLCYDSCDVPIDRLAGQHEELSYHAILREKPGWTKADSWKLGGHGSRFGHIHIDFVKQLDGKWYLKRIWGCR